MKNLITYLKTLWSRGLDSQRKEVGMTLGEATIEHPFSTYSAPFGTCWQPSGKLHSVVRYAAMLVMLFTIGSGNVWGAKDDVVYKINTASTKIATSTTYANYGPSTCASAQAGSTVSSASWCVTCGSAQTEGLWLGANNNQKAKMTLGNGSFTEASGIASAIGVTTSATYYAAMICRTNLSKVYKVTLTYATPGGTAPSEAWILYSTDNGSTWSVGKKVTSLSTSGTDFVFDATITSAARYAFVIHSTGYCQFKKPVLTFYEGTTGGTTYTVTYNLNGGGGTTPTESAKSSGATFTLHNGTTNITPPSGKVFSQWKDQDNNYYNGGATYTMPAKNVTLTAQWVNTYTVTYNLNGGTGTTPTEGAHPSGATFTLHDGTTGITAPTKKEFSKWRDQDGTDYNGGVTYTMPAKAVTLTAQWVAAGGDYVLVEDAEDIGPGKYLIVYNNAKALNTHNGNVNANTYATYTDISSYYSNKKIAANATTNALAYTVAETANGYSISHIESGTTYYLGNSSNSTGAYLRWDNPFTASTDEWTLGVNSIVSARNSNYAIRWNNNNSSYRFAIYNPTGQQAVQLFKQVEACEEAELAYSPATETKTYGDAAFTKTLTNSHGVAVTYALSDVSPAGCVSINTSTGQVTINGAGSATVTASSAKQTVSDVDYCADEASYTLTVNKASISPTLTYTPNSVAVGESTAAPSVGGNSGSGGVTYAITSASPAGCATINTSTGVVTGVAVGSITVTATVAATANYNGNTATATVTINAASNFPNNRTIFIQAHSTSAWTGGGCVKAWFHSYGGSETAQSTYWLFDAGSPDEGKKLFAAIVPSTGNLPYLDIQRFAANCSDWWNKNGGCSYSDADGSNAIRSTGKHDGSSDGDYVRWNDDAVTLGLRGDPDWNNDLATFADQGNGVWTATYNNYAPANAAGESQEFKICTNYNGWIGNSGSNNNVTVDGMHVGSTYNIGATLDIKDHSLTLTKTFVKGTVHFDMQSHGSQIADLTNVAAGSKISAPSTPSATGYDFGGWYKEPECTNQWNFGSDVVNETMTLYAKWTAHEYTITKTLTNVTSSPAIPSTYTYTGAAAGLNYTISPSDGYRLPTTITVTGTTYTWNPATGALALTGTISSNVTITIVAVQTHTVTWMNNGSNYGDPVVYDHGAALAFPVSDPSAPSSCSEKVFVGWTSDSEITSETSTEPTLISEGGAVNADATYRAVFADEEGGGTVTVLSEPFTGFDNNATPSSPGGSATTLDGSNITYTCTAGGSGAGNTCIQTSGGPDNGNNILIRKKSGAFTVNSIPTNSQATATLTYKWRGSGTMSLSGSSNISLGSISTETDASSNNTCTVTITINSGTTYSLTWTNSSNDDNLRFDVPTITCGGTSYDNYITQCCSLKPVTGLNVSSMTNNSVTLSWTLPAVMTGITKFQIVDVDNSNNVVVDNISTSATSATKSSLTQCNTYHYAVVSYGSTCTTISDAVTAQPFSGAKTATFNYNGGTGSPASFTTSCSGNTVTLPTPDTRAGYTFDGWWSAQNGGTKRGDAGDSYTVSGTTTLWAHWSETNYTVTMAQSPSVGATLTGGTTTAHYGGTINISTDVPDGYRFTGWTADPSVTFADASATSTSFTMPNGNVTVTASFVRVYTVTFVHHDKGTYSGASTEVLVPANANTITLPTVTSVSCGFYDTFEGWIASGSEYSESTSKPATVYAGGSSYTVTDDITLRALYSKCEGEGGEVYAKVTTDPGDWSGTYLIINEDYGKAMNGSETQANLVTTSNNVAVTISNSQVVSNSTTDTYAFTIAPHSTASGKYSICSHSGYYIGSNSASNAISATATETTYSNAISITAGVLTIGCGQYKNSVEYRLMFMGTGSGSPIFKYYPNTQGQVCLYKKQSLCTKSYATNPSCVKPTGVHITYNANALDATMSCSTSNKTYKVVDAVNQYPKLASAYTFCDNATRDGYTLVGWNTQANGLGTTYELDHSYSNLPVSGDLDGDNYVTLTVYAMWAPSVSFNVGNATGGTGVPDVIEADGGFMLPTPTAAQIGTIPCGYSFYGWSESSVVATTTKPTLYMPGTKYTGSYRTLYAVYRLAGEGGNPDLFSLSYMVSSTKYYVAAPSGITTAPSTWNNDKAAKFTASTNAEDAVAFGMKTNSEYTSYKEIYWVYDGDEDEKAYLSHSSGANITFKNEEDTYYHKWTVTGSTELTFLYTDGRYLSGTTTEIGCPSDVGVSTFTKEEASTTSYTYATNPSCETTATLAFVTNGGTLNYPTAYDASNYVDLTVGTSVYLPTATYPGEWTFEGWMKGSAVTSTDLRPESANFYTVTLNTTTYSATPAGTTTFYAVFSKTVNDNQFDPDHEGTYKLFAIMSDGTTKKYMPVWDGTQTTLTPVTSCASTGDYTITPGTGVHTGQYKITHGSYTLGVKSDGDTQFKNDADAWWNIEESTSGKGTYRITIVGSSTRCMALSGTGYFSNTIIRNFVDNPSQPNYRDMEIGECIYTEYTSTPENIPYITITGSPIKITSTNGERVYAPTKLHIEAHNFTGTRRINFSATNGFATNPAYVNCLENGSYSGDIDIYYQPTTDGDGNIVSSVLTASQAAESVTQTFAAIQGRNMPQDFVIAVKSGTQWYALPDDCHSSGTPKAVAIEVNDNNAPTAASLVPHNVEWRLSDVVNSSSRPKDKVYFYEPNSTNDYTLYAGSAPNIQTNAQLSNVTGENSYTYEWGLATNDLCAYTISNANVNKNISIDTKGTFGTHATNIVSSTLYLLPITAYYEPAEFQVVEWKANSVVVMYLGNATQASVQVGGNDEGSNQTLSSVKVDHGVYELAASGLTSAYFEPLQIVFKNAGGTEIGRNYVTIPAIINGNVLTSTYESVKDLAESNDVVILKNSKLTTTGTGTDASSYKFTNITVYGGGKLDIASGTKLGVTGSLILRAGGVIAGAYDYVYPQLNLGGTLTNSSGKFYYEYVTDYTRWYHFVLPFDALTSTIKYPTEYYGSAVTANNTGSWVIKRYDGATRATGDYNAWVDIESSGEPTPTTVGAGHGYIFWGAPKKVTANGVKDRQAWGIQRIAMSKAADAAKTEEAGNKTVTGLGSYSGVSGNSKKNNDQGWNLIGNPYMVNLTGLNSTSVQVGQLVHTDTDPWDGKWKWDETDPEAGGLRYVTIPDNHFDNYEAKTMSWFTAENPMKTGRTFFVQIAGANTSVAFAAANRASLMPALFAKVEESVDIETGIVMSDENKHDEVNFWIKDGKTAEYEYNADYPKTPNSSNFNIYGVHSHGDLSWIAISPEIAEGSMAIGYQVPAAGEYTLSLSNTYVSDKIEHLYVTDHAMSPEVTVDLQEAPYAFTVLQAETNNERFTVSIKLKDESPGTTTGIDQIDTQSEQPLKFIYQDKMYILRGGVIYDATGKRVMEINK